jgi:DNA repair protein SbcD/Mre11
MRLLHTADWHLNDKLGKIDRTADLRKRVEKVADICEAEQVDVMVIAGDLFYEDASLDQMHDSFIHLRKTFRGFFQRGGTILAITGNHDRDTRLNLLRSGLGLAAPTLSGDDVLPPGRFYLQNEVAVARLKARGRTVQFVTLPYPYPSRYGLSAGDYKSREEEYQLVRDAVIRRMEQYAPKLDETIHTVLVGHLNVRGSETNSLYKLNPADDHQFEYAELHPSWAYVALGHIHKPQMLQGSHKVQYSGSLDRLDFGEADNNTGVVIVDIEQHGTTARVVPIAPTALLTIDIGDAATEIPALAENHPNLAEAIVKVNVASYFSEEVHRQLRQAIPRLFTVNWIRPTIESGTKNTAAISTQTDLPSVVREYLTRVTEHDPDRENLLELVEDYLRDDRWKELA